MTDTFKHKGEWWSRLPAEPIHKFALGCDLGQSNDYTALSAVEHVREPLDTWSEIRRPSGHHLLKQDARDELQVRHLERLALGIPYPDQVQIVSDMLARPPLRGCCDLVIDQTGVGAPVADLFDQAALRPIRIVIGAGFDPVKHAERKWVVPKGDLISQIDAVLGTGELKISKQLRESPALRDELKDFRRKVSDAGRASYAARVGRHDDLVLSLAIAIWWLRRPSSGEFSVGSVAGCW